MEKNIETIKRISEKCSFWKDRIIQKYNINDGSIDGLISEVIRKTIDECEEEKIALIEDLNEQVDRIITNHKNNFRWIGTK